MTYAPDDNPEIEHDVYLRRLPHPEGRPTWQIFCHAIVCDDPAVQAIVTELREIRLCQVHLDDLTETLIALKGVRESKEA